VQILSRIRQPRRKISEWAKCCDARIQAWCPKSDASTSIIPTRIRINHAHSRRFFPVGPVPTGHSPSVSAGGNRPHACESVIQDATYSDQPTASSANFSVPSAGSAMATSQGTYIIRQRIAGSRSSQGGNCLQTAPPIHIRPNVTTLPLTIPAPRCRRKCTGLTEYSRGLTCEVGLIPELATEDH